MIPGIRAAELEAHFRTSGWDVIELKYGRRLRAAREEEGGEILLRQIDEMPNEQYQSLFGASEEVVRQTVLGGLRRRRSASPRAAARRATADGVATLVRDLGGHDLGDILDALRQARDTTDRPTVIFAYTIKGYGLEIAGRPQNHSALLTGRADRRLPGELRPHARERVGSVRARVAASSSSSSRAAERLDRGLRPPARADRRAGDADATRPRP